MVLKLNASCKNPGETPMAPSMCEPCLYKILLGAELIMWDRMGLSVSGYVWETAEQTCSAESHDSHEATLVIGR